jgi:leucyl aminopeptidase (aminopeptidase T)
MTEATDDAGDMSPRLLKNARITLEVSCRAQPDETVLIVADARFMRYAPALAAAARDIGAVPAVFDISDYVKAPWYEIGRVFPPLVAAMEKADIVLGTRNYGRLIDDPDIHDSLLTCERRWVYVHASGMDKWEITAEEVAAITARTHWLMKLLDGAEAIHVASRAGTDFTCGLGPGSKHVPILGIIPLYGEVAVTPRLGSESGVIVVDGPTQMGVRPRDELDREPLRITVKDGRVVDFTGDPVQVGRLKEFIVSGVAPVDGRLKTTVDDEDSPGDVIDEVGILTTQIADNDVYHWSDGTHHHDCTHIALGNNVHRDTLVHGTRHMDGEVQKPTVSVDGLVVVEGGVFVDSLLTSAGE